MLSVARRLKPVILPVLRWGTGLVPVRCKFRKINGGFTARRWYKRVLRAGV